MHSDVHLNAAYYGIAAVTYRFSLR